MKIGVLSFQGDVSEHLHILEELQVDAVPVKSIETLKQTDGLILPGGESTTLGLLLAQSNLGLEIKKMGENGMPIWGTCMGTILLAKNLINNSVPQSTLELMDISVKRNAFGRQKDSFEQDISIPGLKCETFSAIFIRAPWIEKVGPHVEVLATLQGKTILAKEKNLLASVFHPELGKDTRIHQYFIQMVKDTKIH